MDFAVWIKKEGGASKVARKLDVTPIAVRGWMNGDYGPRVPMAIKILDLSEGKLSLKDLVVKRKSKKR